MRHPLAIRTAATLAALALTVTPARAADGPTNQELLDKVNALQAEVEQLRAEQRKWIASQREVTDTIAAVRTDAAAHSHAVDIATFTAGYRAEKGFVLRSETGEFLLHPFIIAQFRDETTYRESAKPGGRSDTQSGFEMRRMKLGIDGNLFTPNFTYQVIWSADRNGGAVSLEDAWAKYQFQGSPLYVRGGQIRDPLDHEQIVFAPFLLTADRSLAQTVFTTLDGLVQGVSLGYDNDGPVRAEVALTDGMRSQNTNFEDFPTTPANWGVAGRVEWKLCGDWKQYAGFSALNAKQTLVVLGAGADFTEAGDTRQLVHVVDASYASPNGLSGFVAYLGRYTANDAAPPGTNGASTAATHGPDTYDATVRVQLGYLIAKRVEPFVRYEFIHFDAHDPLPPGHRSINDITAGVNWYLQGHRARLTFDATYLPNGSPVTETGSGVLYEPTGQEFIFRAQFQLIL